MSKTPAFENLRQAARRYRRQTDLRDYQQGIKVFHNYDNHLGEAISWWDDVNFLYSDYLVAIRWLHPRQAFQDELNKRVEQSMAAHFATIQPAPLKFKALYRPQGRSRKKLRAWENELAYDELSWQDWRHLRQTTELQLLSQQSIQIRPFWRIHWSAHARQVELCTPVEIHNVADLNALVSFTKGLLRADYQLADHYTAYCYQNSDWLAEQALRQQSKTQFQEWQF